MGHITQAPDTLLPVLGACSFGGHNGCTTHDADLATDLCNPRPGIRRYRMSLPLSASTSGQERNGEQGQRTRCWEDQIIHAIADAVD